MAYIHDLDYHTDSKKVTLSVQLHRSYEKDEHPVTKYDIAEYTIALALELERRAVQSNWHSPEPVCVHVRGSRSTLVSITAVAPENRCVRTSYNFDTPDLCSFDELYKLIRSKLSKLTFIKVYMNGILAEHFVNGTPSEEPAELHMRLLKQALPPESHPLLASNNDNIYRAVWMLVEHQSELGLF